MISTQYIKLNMIPNGVLPVLYCSQYDIGRPLGLIVYNGSQVVDMDSYTVTVEGTRNDGTPVTANVTTSDNIGVFTTTATMTNKDNAYKMKLVLVDGNENRVASIPFLLVVVAKTMDEDAESIEEDASLYQQYTNTVQGLIATINANLAAEATARQNADNTLQSNINTEAGTRASADNVLQAEIDQLIAPSGSAPSAAEIENARVGADGVTYSTLGDAIRTQVTDVKSQIESNASTGFTFVLGTVNGQGGKIDSTTRIRTDFIKASAGDVVAITSGDYNISCAKYDENFEIIETSGWQTGTYYKINTDGFIIIVVRKTGDATISPGEVASIGANVFLTDEKTYRIKVSDEINNSLKNGYAEVSIKDTVEQGGLYTDGLNSTINSTTRIRSGYYSVFPGRYLVKYTSSASLEYSVSFYITDDYTTARTGYTDFTDAPELIVPSGCKYIRIIFKKTSNATVSPSDLTECTITRRDIFTLCNAVACPSVTYAKGSRNADGSGVLTSNNAVYTNIIGLPYIIELSSTCHAQMLLYRGGEYIGKVRPDNTLDKASGNWKLFYGYIDMSNIMLQYNADAVRLTVWPDDSTTITDASAQTYGEAHVTVYASSVVGWADGKFAEKQENVNTNFAIGSDLLKRPISVTELGQLTYLQAFCLYDGKYYSTNGSAISVQDSTFTETDSATLSLGHGNNMQLGTAHPNYAYISGWNDQTVHVVDLDTLTIVDTITIPLNTGYTTCAIDDVNEIAYIFHGSSSSSSSEVYYDFVVYDYANEEIISTKKLTRKFGAMQSCDFIDGKIIALNGLGSSAVPNNYVVYNTVGDIIGEYLFGDFSSVEPEGVCIDRDSHELYISFVNRKLFKVSAVTA